MRVIIKNPKLENQSFDGYQADEIYTIDDVGQKIAPASLTSIDCLDILDYIPNRHEGMGLFLSKLRYGGRISFTGTDIDLVALQLVNRKINVETAAQVLFNGKMSTSSLLAMNELLQRNGFTIMNSKVEGISYFITAQRNAN